MTTAPASGVGWTLAKLAALRPRRANSSTDSVSQSRELILKLLRASPEPLLIEDLCAATALHANTVRGHLDILVASGDVARDRGSSNGRGRPPWRYRAAGGAQRAVAELRTALDAHLGTTEGEERAFVAEAAQRWAEALGPELAPAPASNPSEAVEAAAAVLTDVGFSAEVSPLGDSITLHTCPYASLIADHPVICDIHTALLSDVLDRTGQGVTVAQMDVFVTPSACLARLNRPDRVPIRTVKPESDPNEPRTRTLPKRKK